jgi:hypothetical protein
MGQEVSYISQNRVIGAGLINDTPPVNAIYLDVRSIQTRGDGRRTDNVLTGRAFDEPFGVADNSHFDRIANALTDVKFISGLVCKFTEVGWRTSKNRPSGGASGCELEGRVCVVAEGADGENFAAGIGVIKVNFGSVVYVQSGPSLGEWRGRDVLVTEKVDSVEEKAECDG